jgi:hypothetical protein
LITGLNKKTEELFFMKKVFWVGLAVLMALTCFLAGCEKKEEFLILGLEYTMQVTSNEGVFEEGYQFSPAGNELYYVMYIDGQPNYSPAGTWDRPDKETITLSFDDGTSETASITAVSDGSAKGIKNIYQISVFGGTYTLKLSN